METHAVGVSSGLEPSSRGRSIGSGAACSSTYEEIMGISAPSGDAQDGGGGGGSSALATRLVAFRSWLTNEANVTVHPSVCIVNGEATDGTKNAPVLTFGPPPSATTSGSSSGAVAAGTGRCGMVDNEVDRALYDRTIGCQVRAAKELKKDDVVMTVPRSSMVTPDLVASSDAGRAVLACCHPLKGSEKTGFWDAFENTTICERKYGDRVARNMGTQLLVKILHERKKAETANAKSLRELDAADAELDGKANQNRARPYLPYKLAPPGTISTRAPILAFLIHQRFANDISPPVVSNLNADDRPDRTDGADVSALSSIRRMKPPQDSPSTFAPYIRTFPSAVPLPICWKRNELALLAGCIPGVASLQEVAARTLQLSSEFIALVEAGILHRFPDTFPRGLITWERWIWAASVFSSRVLPVSCYLNKGEKSAGEHARSNAEIFQSPPEIWDELGVMVPLLDMLNHESEASQVTWEPCVPPGADKGLSNGGIGSSSDAQMDSQSDNRGEQTAAEHPPRAIIHHKRVKKGSQIYCSYGNICNQNLIMQYGFAQMNNPSDEVRIGWGLADAVGNIPAPSDYTPAVLEVGKEPEGKAAEGATSQNKTNGLVYESTDSACINSWWTQSRLGLLEKEALVSNSFMTMLKAGKKMTGLAYSDGSYHPIFLTAAVIGTMPTNEVEKCLSKKQHPQGQSVGVGLTRKHQQILRKYLAFVFTRKLEKLLQSLNNGIKDHFNSVQLWTKASQGGLQYSSGEDGNGDDVACMGWQTFFDLHAYTTAMEVEKSYYAIGPDSCVLALYDGHLRSLQASIDGISTQEKFENTVLRQLEDLGFVILKDDNVNNEVRPSNGSGIHGGGNRGSNTSEGQGKGRQTAKGLGDKTKAEAQAGAAGGGKGSGGEKSNKRRNRKKGDRPPALKLHVGNLAYSTKPADLFDFFAGMYGRENILECHIPTERDSGRSRGFGFVTMPEAVALKALHSGCKHEIDGRLLKVAESNSAGTGKNTKSPIVPVVAPSDRCASCGYTPKYCTCNASHFAGYNGSAGMPGGPSFQGDEARPLSMDPNEYGGPHGRNAPEPDYYGTRGHRSSRSWRSYSRSSSPRRGSSRGNRDDGYGRDYDRGYRDFRHGRSRSRSYSRSRDRERSRRDRGGTRERERSRDSRSSGRRSSRSREWERRSSRGRSRSAEGSRTRNYSNSPPSRRDRKTSDVGSKERAVLSRARSLSRSMSPPQSRSNASGPGSERKREGHSRKRSRSRSRGRSGRRKRSSKKEGSRRHARSKSRSLSRSRSTPKD